MFLKNFAFSVALRENIFMPFKFVGFNLQESLNDKIDEAAERAGVKRSEFIRNALCAAIEAQGIKILPEDLASNQGARNDLPNRITEAEKRSRKGMRPRGRSRKEEARLIKRAKKEVAKIALAFGKAQTPAEARSLADQAVRPGETI